jgi:Zn-dependent protease with chaperone function
MLAAALLLSLSLRASSAPGPLSAPQSLPTDHEDAGQCPDPSALFARVQKAADELMPAPELAIDLRYFDTEGSNAEAEPANERHPKAVVTVWKGLLEAVQEPDQLGFVLAHEIAHLKLRHGRLELERLVSWLKAHGNLKPSEEEAFLAERFPSSYFQKVRTWQWLPETRKFLKEQEAEADSFGTIIAERAGLDAKAGSRFFAIQAKETLGAQFLVQAGSEHPSNDDRMEALYAQTAPLGEYLQKHPDLICGSAD